LLCLYFAEGSRKLKSGKAIELKTVMVSILAAASLVTLSKLYDIRLDPKTP
jgi:hypothetical protein